MADAEYTVYINATNQTDPKAKAAAIEDYLTKYPQSSVKLNTLVLLMAAYSAIPNNDKTLDAADRILQLDPTNAQALYGEAMIRKAGADALTDAAAKQAALDAAASFAQKALTAHKPDTMTDDAFKQFQASSAPSYYSIIAYAAYNKKDNATAIDTYKKEIAAVPPVATQTPGPVLQDIYYLAVSYYQSTPPDLLSCAFYGSRVAAFAPDSMKSQYAPLAKWCYKKYHDGDDGYDAFMATAKANLNPPDGLFASIKPGLTPAEKIHGIISTTPDLATLAIPDKEMVFQYGSPEDAAKVWDTIKGKSVQIPGALVVESSPTVLKVAISDDSVQNKTADFTFNMAPPETIEEPGEKATPTQKLAYKKAVAEAAKKADAIAAATAVGKTVTLTGTYDSFTANPIQIIMKDGEVILAKPAAAKPAAKAAPAHHAAPARHK
jgi:hypothetical protein